eukprot:TRINITY_DN16358_c0_g1_i1.p1 TRINITY_DN16358_c0_g1~~TRINITY_DN16358_c0_g1_i1.p1  ORF type:complete len:327 (-),score=74.56 TRINITY_DN16358_c0_g1_i1:620-1552(-)
MACAMERLIDVASRPPADGVSLIEAALPSAAYCPTKLFIGGLSKKTSNKALREHFSKYGRVLDCIAMCKGEKNQARHFGFVTLASIESAALCLAGNHILDGHVLDVKPAEGKTATSISTPAKAAKTLSVVATLGPPPGLSAPAPEALKQVPTAVETKDEESDEEASTAVASVAGSSGSTSVPSEPADSDEEETVKSQESVADLPSLGSALHAAGGCKPCNFFAKGKCASGPSCNFCHLPHQARRATRQEKRDRAERWMQKQMDKAAAESCESMAAAESPDDASGLDRRWSRMKMLEVFAAMQLQKARAVA